MRLSRIDLVPVLAIVAGGVIGASLSFSFVERSRSDDVQPVVVDVPAVRKPVLKIEVDGYPVVTAERIEVRGLVVTPSATRESAIQTVGPDGSVITSASIKFDGMVISPVFVRTSPNESWIMTEVR